MGLSIVSERKTCTYRHKSTNSFHHGLMFLVHDGLLMLQFKSLSEKWTEQEFQKYAMHSGVSSWLVHGIMDQLVWGWALVSVVLCSWAGDLTLSACWNARGGGGRCSSAKDKHQFQEGRVEILWVIVCYRTRISSGCVGHQVFTVKCGLKHRNTLYSKMATSLVSFIFLQFSPCCLVPKLNI